MKRRTYRNFMLVMDILTDVKHYTKGEAEKITRQIFNDVEADKGRGDRSAEWFLARIISKEEWLDEMQQGEHYDI